MTLPDPDSLEALLLDLDDTILDHDGGLAEARDRTLAFLLEERPELDPEALRAAYGASADWFWSDPERHRRGRLDLPAARVEVLARALERFGAGDPELVAEAARRHTALRDAGFRLLEGALESLRALRGRFARLALVTNGASEPQRGKVERFGLAPFFDHIQVEGEFGAGKPEERVFRHVAVALEVEPQRCLMVGDNFEADVLGSLRVGMHAAWIAPRGRPAPARAPRPHATLASLVELAEHLA